MNDGGRREADGGGGDRRLRSAFEQRMADLEELLLEAERSLPAPALERTRAIVSALLDVHREGLAALTAALGSQAEGAALLRRVADDPAIASMLALHELHPHDLETRARRAVRDADDAAGKRGLVELEAVEGDAVHVIISARDGSAAALVERLVDATLASYAPEARLVVKMPNVAPSQPSRDLIPADRLRRGPAAAH